jgi:hypothetical protein
MPDTNNVTTQTIEIDTSKAYDSIADLTRQLGDMTTIAAEAKEGIQYVGNEYQFANNKLQAWYDELQKMGLAHNKVTTDIINDMQNAAKASQVATNAAIAHGAAIKKGSDVVLGSLEHQKLAFEDIGRIALGEKFGLRQFGQLFGVLGPVIGIAAFALTEYGSQLLELVAPTDAATKAQQDFVTVVSKAADKAAEGTIAVEKMNEQFKDAVSVSDRKAALDEYNKTFGETIGYAKTFEQAEQRLKDHTADYISAMTFRAQADAAYGLQKEALAKAAKAQVEEETGFFAKVKAYTQAYFGAAVEGAETLKKSTKGIVDENNQAAESYAKIAHAAEDSFNKVKQAAGGGTGKPGKDKKAEHDNSIEEQKRYLDESQKITENAEEKEITSEKIKYDKIRTDLIAHHHSTEQLDEQHEQNVADIHQKYADKLAEEFKKEAAKADADAAKQTEEFLKNAAKLAAEKEKEAAKDLAERKKDASKFLTDEFQQGALELKYLKGHYDQKRALLASEAAQNKGFYADGLISREQYNKNISELDAAALEIKKQQAEQEKMIANAATSTLDSLSKIAGEKTQAGKDLAIASATIKAIQAGINTFEGFTSEFPGPVGIALGAIAAAGVGITLFEEVKKIESVKIPGGSGGASSSAAAPGSGGGSVPGAPAIPAKSNATNLSSSTISQLKPNQNTEPIRAVVVESDITSSQQRMQSYQNGSSLH